LKSKERIGECLVLNPGEVGAYKTGIGSYAIYNTETNDAEIFEINKL
jgi:predicted phosphodiesterase